MRRLDDTPLDPQIAASLEAIDATLADEPVDPAYAEVAELALLLRAERAQPRPDFANALDERVRRRFAPVQPQKRRQRHVRRWWLWTPAAGFAAALLAAIVIVIGAGPGGGSASSSGTVAARAESSPHAGAAATAKRAASQPSLPRRTSSAPTFGPMTAASSAPGTLSVLQPPSNGRKIIQSAQLSLTARASRIDDVAQEVFVVVGQVHGIVNSSQVTATGGPGGYAQFQLRIPSGSMPQAMAALSTMRYARVASRTDSTQDVNDQYQADVRKLADDRTRRTVLLGQLVKAATPGEIDSLTAKIHDTEAEISRDEATLAGLNHQIAYSQVTVTINGGVVPVPAHSGSGGSFNLRRAVHDAGRVLTVAAGVALVGLAALVPVGLLGALAWWIASVVRRRRREQALDLV